jgi:hypothetical protein
MRYDHYYVRDLGVLEIGNIARCCVCSACSNENDDIENRRTVSTGTM